MRYVVNSVRIEHSEKYDYLYFFFASGRVLGIPNDSTAFIDLTEVVNELATDEWDEV